MLTCQEWQDKIFVHRFFLDEFTLPVDVRKSRTGTKCRSFTFARLRDCVAYMTLLICVYNRGADNSKVQGSAEIPDDLQHSCEWNSWRGGFVLERPPSETQSISVAMELWSVEHRAFAVETYF